MRKKALKAFIQVPWWLIESKSSRRLNLIRDCRSLKPSWIRSPLTSLCKASSAASRRHHRVWWFPTKHLPWQRIRLRDDRRGQGVLRINSAATSAQPTTAPSSIMTRTNIDISSIRSHIWLRKPWRFWLHRYSWRHRFWLMRLHRRMIITTSKRRSSWQRGCWKSQGISYPINLNPETRGSK